MATTITHVIDPDLGTGYDYASLSAWEAAQQRDLTAVDEIASAKCRSTGSSDDTTAFTITGWTTDATRYIDIWKDGNEYRLTTADTTILQIKEDYTRITGITFHVSTPTASARHLILISSGFIAGADSDIRISNCIFKGHNHATYNQKACIIYDGNVKIWNSIFYNFNAALSNNYGIDVAYAGTDIAIYNCAIYGFYRGITNDNTEGNRVVYNSAVFGNGNDDFAGTALDTVDHCASDDGDGTNAVVPSNWANVFIDYTNGNFHLKATDTDLTGTGLDDPGSGLFSTDIDGDTWVSPWSIGVDQKVSAIVRRIFCIT